MFPNKSARAFFRCCLSCHFYFGWNTFSFGYLINLGFNIVCSQRQKTSAEKSIHNFIYIFLLLNAKVYAWIVPYFREERVMIPRRTLNHPIPLQRCAVFSPISSSFYIHLCCRKFKLFTCKSRQINHSYSFTFQWLCLTLMG